MLSRGAVENILVFSFEFREQINIPFGGRVEERGVSCGSDPRRSAKGNHHKCKMDHTMTKTFNYTDVAAQLATFEFFSPKNCTLLSTETCRATELWSDIVLELLERHLSELEGRGTSQRPVALWFQHRERGDARRSSLSRLYAVLYLEEGALVARPWQALPAPARSALLEILGALFLEEDLCEALYHRAGFSVFQDLDVVHFRNFSLLRGDTDTCDVSSLEDLLEARDFDCDTRALKLARHPWATTETDVHFDQDVKKAVTLIHRAAHDQKLFQMRQEARRVQVLFYPGVNR